MIEYKNAWPKRAHVELSSKCNFKCITCKHGYIHYGQDMDDDVCDVLVDEIIPHLEEIELQGTGESLLSKHFDRVFDAVTQNSQCRINLITNASLFNYNLIKRFVQSNMQIVYSLDGANQDIFKLHRPVGDFSRIMENIALVRDMRRKVISNSLSTVINMVLTRYNVTTIKDMIDLASRMDIDHLFVSEVRPCMPDKELWERLRLDHGSREDLQRNIVSAQSYAKDKGIGFSFNPYHREPVMHKAVCPSPWQHIFLTAEGNVSFCCELNTFFGNIKYLSLKEVWNGEKAHLFRNQMLLKEYHEKCLKCCLPWGITHD